MRRACGPHLLLTRSPVIHPLPPSPAGGSASGRPAPPRRERVGPPPPTPPRGAGDVCATELAGATGPPRPVPAVQRDEARRGGRDVAARIANRSLVVGRPAAGRGRRHAIDPARARRWGAAGAVGAGGRGRRKGHEAAGAEVPHGVREPRARPGALGGAGRTAPSWRIVNSRAAAPSAQS